MLALNTDYILRLGANNPQDGTFTTKDLTGLSQLSVFSLIVPSSCFLIRGRKEIKGRKQLQATEGIATDSYHPDAMYLWS